VAQTKGGTAETRDCVATETAGSQTRNKDVISRAGSWGLSAFFVENLVFDKKT
jgi:hypothetical protein